MAVVPGGALAFLYHVTYDAEFNRRFGESPESEEEVMEFFQIPLRLKQVVRKISEDERKELDNLNKLRKEVKKMEKNLTNSSPKAKNVLKSSQRVKDMKALSAKKRECDLKEETFMKRTVVFEEDMKIVLETIEEELSGGVYRRFW